ncbi:uncharacterized protein LOC135349713 [Halichondria panicea]|uniref:uncharacterized protein LOC135349713 n=1 Tax=Halichondria panicea TaxID=6063 RepID=UPI00312BCB33
MGVLFNIILCALASTVAGRCNRYCYTKWMDRDNPSGKGDYENFRHVSKTTVCPEPVGIQCQTTTGAPYKSTGDSLAVACEPRGGLACINSDQRLGKQCNDYRVRYLCPEGSIPDTRGIVCNDFYETSFTDRDNPGGHCDCETVNLPKNSCLGGATPAGIRCNDVRTNKDFAVFGQKMTCKPDSGGICWNRNNPGGCRDYKVQYICPFDVEAAGQAQDLPEGKE